MKNQIQHRIATIALATISMTTMVACSSGSSGGSSSSVTAEGSTINAAGQAITNCSQSNAGISDFNMQLESSTVGVPNTANSNYVRVRFNAFPATFTSSSALIAFFAYTSTSAGSYTTMVQVPFYLEHYTGSSTFATLSSEMSSISWAQLASEASSAGVSSSSAAIALQNITFVIDLSSVPSSTVLSAALYLYGAGTVAAPASPQRYLQALIPSFLANPSDYENPDAADDVAAHDSTLLALHPFYSYLNSGYSETQFASMGSALCF